MKESGVKNKYGFESLDISDPENIKYFFENLDLYSENDKIEMLKLTFSTVENMIKETPKEKRFDKLTIPLRNIIQLFASLSK